MSNEIEQAVQRAFEAQKERRYDDAKREWTTVAETSRQQDDIPELAWATRWLGEIERKLHNHAAARMHYEEAVKLYRGLPDPLVFAHTIRHLGDVYHESHLPQLAEPCYREAIAIYRAHPEASPLDVANAIRSMAVLKGELGEREEARKLWEEVHQLYLAVGVEAGIAESSARLAGLAQQAG